MAVTGTGTGIVYSTGTVYARTTSRARDEPLKVHPRSSLALRLPSLLAWWSYLFKVDLPMTYTYHHEFPSPSHPLT